MRARSLLGWTRQQREHRYTLAEAAIAIGRGTGHTRALLFHLGYHGHHPCDPRFKTTWDQTQVDALKVLLGQQPTRKVDKGQVDWLAEYLHLKEGATQSRD